MQAELAFTTCMAIPLLMATYYGYTATVATLLTISILTMAAGGAGGVGLPDGTAAAAAG